MAQGKTQPHGARTASLAWHALALASGSLLLLGLAACADPIEDALAAKGNTVDPVCRDVALDRAADAQAQGMNEETRKQVLRRAYADCADWHVKEGTHSAAPPDTP